MAQNSRVEHWTTRSSIPPRCICSASILVVPSVAVVIVGSTPTVCLKLFIRTTPSERQYYYRVDRLRCIGKGNAVASGDGKVYWITNGSSSTRQMDTGHGDIYLMRLQVTCRPFYNVFADVFGIPAFVNANKYTITYSGLNKYTRTVS